MNKEEYLQKMQQLREEQQYNAKKNRETLDTLSKEHVENQRKENDRYREVVNKWRDGMNHYNKYVKPQKIIQKDLQGNFIAIYENAAEASKATGVCQRNIKQVAGKEEFCPGHVRKQAGGFIWEQVSR